MIKIESISRIVEIPRLEKFQAKNFGGKMTQKKALLVTLVLFLLAFIQTQLIWFGYSPLFNGYGALILIGGLSTTLFVVLVIQIILYLATKKK
jgi:hypothetical protein